MTATIMSFNLRYNNPNDGRYAWPNRKTAIRDVISAHNPDVLCTQEGLEDMLEEISRAFPAYDRFGHGRMADGSDEHVAIFVNTSRLRVRAHGQFWISPEPEVPGSRAWDTLFPRICTWCVVEAHESGELLAVFNVHLDNRQVLARQEGARLLCDMMPRIALEHDVPPGAVILCGDFNAYPDTPEVQLFCDVSSVETGAYTMFGCDEISLGTYHGFRGVPAPAPIDYILNGAAVTVHSRTVDQKQYDDTWPSDHFPVIAEISVSGQG